MKRFLNIATSVIAGLLIGASVTVAAQTTTVVSNGDSLVVQCANGRFLSASRQSASQITAACAALPATATPVATATPPPPTPIPGGACVPLSGWHSSMGHVGQTNIHEHGIAPPQWVLNSPYQPFMQCREAHVGYKGYAADDQNGKDLVFYWVPHITFTEQARVHGDHDFTLHVARKSTGQLLYFDRGLLAYSPPPITQPIIKRTTDTGERPIILSQGGAGGITYPAGDSPCETWYNLPGYGDFDSEYLTCDKPETFQGALTGFDGTTRRVGIGIYGDRLTDPNRTRVFMDPSFPALCGANCGFLLDLTDYGTASYPN